MEAAAEQFTAGVEEAALLLEKTLQTSGGQGGESPYSPAGNAIGEKLHQEPGLDTWRMACAIITNALVFHYSIASDRGSILKPSAREFKRASDGNVNPEKLLNTWNEILNINYWPIFSVARDVLNEFPTTVAAEILTHLDSLATDLVGLGATTTSDLSGQMFGALISDRKFLATFYTLPSSAHLLAEAAVARISAMSDVPSVSDGQEQAKAVARAISSVRVADLACGTRRDVQADPHTPAPLRRTRRDRRRDIHRLP